VHAHIPWLDIVLPLALGDCGSASLLYLEAMLRFSPLADPKLMSAEAIEHT